MGLKESHHHIFSYEFPSKGWMAIFFPLSELALPWNTYKPVLRVTCGRLNRKSEIVRTPGCLMDSLMVAVASQTIHAIHFFQREQSKKGQRSKSWDLAYFFFSENDKAVILLLSTFWIQGRAEQASVYQLVLWKPSMKYNIEPQSCPIPPRVFHMSI